MNASICLFCGAEGEGDMPPGHEFGLPCPTRGTAPCPTCGARRGESCTVLYPSKNAGKPTRDHAQRTSPSLALDVLAPKSIGNVVDLATERTARR